MHISRVTVEDLRRLMRARLSQVEGNLHTLHTNLTTAIGVGSAVEIRLDFLHLVVYDDRLASEISPFHGLVEYDEQGDVIWFHPLLLEVAARCNLYDSLERGLNSYFDYLSAVLKKR